MEHRAAAMRTMAYRRVLGIRVCVCSSVGAACLYNLIILESRVFRSLLAQPHTCHMPNWLLVTVLCTKAMKRIFSQTENTKIIESRPCVARQSHLRDRGHILSCIITEDVSTRLV